MAKIEQTTYQIPYANTVVDLRVDDQGEGQTFLLLHGGAGPGSVARFASLLSEKHSVRVITPTHPGFNGTTRPNELNSVRGLAQLYAELLSQLEVDDVTVIGNSVGGWIAAEMALLTIPHVDRIILVNAVGIDVPNHPVTDISKLSPDELMSRSYHDPKPFRIDPASLTDVQRAGMAANRSALNIYGGTTSTDPSLAGRLAKVSVPVLIVWGASDRIVDVDYGRAWAGAIPNAKFLLLSEAGHVPQIEKPEKLVEVIWNYVEEK